MKYDSSPERRGETETDAIAVPMHEQLFYLVGFHYNYDFLEVNLLFLKLFLLWNSIYIQHVVFRNS